MTCLKGGLTDFQDYHKLTICTPRNFVSNAACNLLQIRNGTHATDLFLKEPQRFN